jgi:hypothetical protein
MYIRRFIEKRLIEASQHMPAVAVIGARQVGKSTLLRHCFPDADIVVFDPVMDVENARRDPDLFLQNHRTPLILDEIQYAPEVSAAVKRVIDKDRRPGQFLLTGSQQWQVMKHLADSLSGRVAILELEGFTLLEMGGKSDSWMSEWLESPDRLPKKRLDIKRTPTEQIWRGFLPQPQVLPEGLVGQFMEDYLRTYIERDARQAGNVEDWQLFGRFARLVFALSAQELNRNHIGRELGLHPQTAGKWVSMLTASCQWKEIPPWHGNASKRLTCKPKGYCGDSGLMASALGISSPRALLTSPAFGALFETAMVGEIRRQLSTAGVRLYHWRSHGGAEVDLVIERDGLLYPIEIKAASRPSGHDARGLSAFRETYPKLTAPVGLILAPAETAYALSADTWVIPWDAM